MGGLVAPWEFRTSQSCKEGAKGSWDPKGGGAGQHCGGVGVPNEGLRNAKRGLGAPRKELGDP